MIYPAFLYTSWHPICLTRLLVRTTPHERFARGAWGYLRAWVVFGVLGALGCLGADVNEIAGASVSVVTPHARAEVSTDALENDTRGAAAWAEGFGPTQAAAPTQFPPGNARQQGGYAAFLDVSSRNLPRRCLTNPAGAFLHRAI